MRCYSCFHEYQGNFAVCPFCGTPVITEPVEKNQLVPGTVLAGRYILGQAIGSGGFGIVYRALDSKLETIVAVKEFFVSRLVTRAEGTKDIIVTKNSMEEFLYRKDRFLAEARNMAKFGNHRNIPNVFNFFEENGTAYIVMELLEGMTLNDYLKQEGGKIDIDLAVMIAAEIGNALKSLHQQKIIHRDVAPDNIFICQDKDLKIKLMDLGAAKLADKSADVIDIILKPGYSPIEQYNESSIIGPWTDIYALGATLYVMVTGEKPDEATNRKIEDSLKSPMELNPLVSENLSNTIMKAMAADPHMRFQTIDEFLQALKGERKVDPLDVEIRKKKIKRMIGISAACIAVAIISGLVFYFFTKKRDSETLQAASISVWFSVTADSAEEEAMKAVIDDFSAKFPKVTIDLQAIPENEYAERILDAARKDELPALFESSGLSEEVLDETVDLDAVLSSEQAGECLFLDQYKYYYDGKKQIPLGIEIPMAFVITNGPVSLDYDSNYFSDLSDFGEGTKIAMDEDCRKMLYADFRNSSFEDMDSFLNTDESGCPVLLSSTMRINEIRNDLIKYEKSYVYYKSEEINCNFTYEWSIGKSGRREQKAAETLLSWMLGNVYQQYLMIKKASDGQIPLNAVCFNEKIHSHILEPVSGIYESFVFER